MMTYIYHEIVPINIMK